MSQTNFLIGRGELLTNEIKGPKRMPSKAEVYSLHQSEHDYPMELLFVGVGNEGGDVIETVLIIFGLGFVGITLAISVICFMVWLALNES